MARATDGKTPRHRSGRTRHRIGASPAASPAKSAASDQTVLLAWARDGQGTRVGVAELDPADRHKRAPFQCLGCGEELTPHLGKVRARHFAHHPGSTCPLTAPETALHLNAKLRLLELCQRAFAGQEQVVLVARCQRCRRRLDHDLAALGDAVEVEGRVGALRPDLLLTHAGSPSLALEVRVTHAVDAAKEESLAGLRLRAVEVDAREEWERLEAGTVAILGSRSLGFDPCPSCQTEARSALGREEGGEAADLAELEAYRGRGLFGPRPGLPVSGSGDPGPITALERRRLSAEFLCPECGSSELAIGERLARHPCPGRSLRAVAWRGYDGQLVILRWWKREERGRGGSGHR